MTQLAEVSPAQRRAEWLELRRQHITSTDTAKILGVSEHGAAIDVWLDKRNAAEQAPPPEWMEWGNRLQPAILEGYADKVQVPIQHVDPYGLIRSDQHPLFAASLDARWTQGDQRPVDAKNVGFLRAELWGDEWTDQIPADYIVQLQHQMLVTNTPVADLAALFGGRLLRVYRVQRDEEIIQAILEAGTNFWLRYIEPGTQPPVDASATWTKLLNASIQRTQQIIEAGPQEQAWAADLREADLRYIAAETKYDELANNLRAAIGEHAGMKGPGFRIAFKQSKPTTKIEWEQVAMELAQLAGPDAFKSAVEGHTSTKPGVRSFRVTWTEGN